MTETATLDLEVNAAYVLDLLGLATTGYSWVYDLSDARIVNVAQDFIVAANPKPGERGIARYTLTGLARGSCVLDLRQIRSWEKDKAPINRRKIQINVK